MSERRAMLQAAVLAVLVLLLGQFVIGMAVNLYVAIPAHHSGSHPANYFTGSLHSLGWAIGSGRATLAVHALLGMFLVFAAAIVLALAIRTHRRATIAAAVLGIAFIIGAGFNGASFLDFNDNTSSMIMSLLFALAVLAYIGVLVLGSRTSEQQPAAPARG
jgi:hypothetical protein